MQPIALLELGDALHGQLPIAIGADPSYPRRTDVVLQCRYTRPALPVRDHLREVVEDLRRITGAPRQR